MCWLDPRSHGFLAEVLKAVPLNSARKIAEPGYQNQATERITVKLAELGIKATP